MTPEPDRVEFMIARSYIDSIHMQCLKEISIDVDSVMEHEAIHIARERVFPDAQIVSLNIAYEDSHLVEKMISSTLVVFFFFKRSGAHRNLRSFPTRRFPD